MPRGQYDRGQFGRREQSPRDIAAYGHVAIALRAALEAKGLPVRPITLCRIINRPTSFTPANKWLTGTGAPGPLFRQVLADYFGIPPESLQRRATPDDSNITASRSVPLIAGPMPQAAPMAHPMPVKPAKPGEVLSFSATADGEVRIRLDVVLPMAQAMPLFRVLMDAGVLIGGGEAEAE